MYCTKCGKQIRDGSKFCGFCGANLSVEERQVSENTMTLENVRKKANQLYQENAPKVKEVINTAGERAGQIYQENAPKVKDAINNASEKATQLYQENAPKVKQALDTAGTVISEKAQSINKETGSADSKKKGVIALIAAAIACLAFVGVIGMIFGRPEPSMEAFKKQAQRYAKKHRYNLEDIYFENVDDDTFAEISDIFYTLAYNYLHTKERAVIVADYYTLDPEGEGKLDYEIYMEILYCDFWDESVAEIAYSKVEEEVEGHYDKKSGKNYQYMEGSYNGYYWIGIYRYKNKMLLCQTFPGDVEDAQEIAKKCGFITK